LRDSRLSASSHPGNRFITVSANRADRVEAMLRQADASFEKWFRRTRKQSAGVLRHRVDDLQTALKKLSEGLKQLERDHKVTLANDRRVAPSKGRTRPAVARKPAALRKRKKAA
jgi:hypothetical protein